ncbi:hypothetical protein SNE40_006032 [Patella caerulea]|uniref:Ig-like domain-containing protein n=1 Tax=Patella caerulea TaxID=87958 RepID=A0AAN8K087_PATCE
MDSCGGCYLMLLCLVVLKDSVSQTIIPEHPDQTVLVGCNARLVWRLNGQDKKTSVFKKSQQLYNDRKYKIDKSQDNKVILIIRNVTVDDGGIYRCQMDSADDGENIYLTITDFQWQNGIKTKAVSVGDTVTIVWTYTSLIVAHKIWIYRQNGIKQDRVVGEQNMTDATGNRMMVYQTIGIDGTHTVNFTVRDVTVGDLKYMYMPKLQFSDDCFKYDKIVTLKEKQVIHIYSKTTIIKALPQDDVSFIWYYEYTYHVLKIIFKRYKTTKQIDKVGYWINGVFESKISDIKLMFNKTEVNITNGIKGQITLTFLNAAIEDFDYTYICQMTFYDQKRKSWNIYLQGK